MTDEAGNSNTAELEPGTYYVKEIKAPEGYQLDPEVYPAAVIQEETRILETADAPVWDTLGLLIEKQDAESMEGHPLGVASLAGAEFTVCFYGGYYTADNLPEATGTHMGIGDKRRGEGRRDSVSLQAG